MPSRNFVYLPVCSLNTYYTDFKLQNKRILLQRESSYWHMRKRIRVGGGVLGLFVKNIRVLGKPPFLKVVDFFLKYS